MPRKGKKPKESMERAFELIASLPADFDVGDRSKDLPQERDWNGVFDGRPLPRFDSEDTPSKSTRKRARKR